MDKHQVCELAFLVHQVDRAVIGDGRRSRRRERSQRLFVVERLRERECDLREKRVAVSNSVGKRLGLLPLRNITCDFRCTDHRAVLSEHRRNGQRNRDEPPIAAFPHCFEMIDAAAGANRCEHGVFLGLAIVGNDLPNRTADHLGSGETEHPLGRGVPRLNDAVQVLADNRIV